MDNLPPQLNLDQLKSSIDKLKQAGKDTNTIQDFVNHYDNTGGTFTLKDNSPKSTFVPQERNLLQKGAGLILDPLTKLADETGQLAGKGIVRGIEAFQSPEQKAKTEAGLQNALNAPSQVPGLGTEVKGLNDVTAKDVAGQVLETGAMFAPGVGKAASLGAKTLAGAATGYAFDVANNLQSGDKTVGESLVPGVSTVVGGALPVVGKGLEYLSKNLPQWFIQKALPKLDSKNTDFALKTLDAGTVKTNLEKATSAVKSSGKVIDNILNHPQYESEVGNISSVIPSVMEALPNAGLDNKVVVDTLKSLAPKNATLVDKLAKGTLNIAEQNTLRQELDRAIYPSIADKINPKLSFDKSVGKIVTDALRTNVQTTAPETAKLFESFSKEINLQNALKFAKSKIEKGSPVSLYDIGAGIGGGIPGIVGERVARTPSALITVAKGVNAVGKSKVLPKIGKVIKKPVLDSLSSLNN